MNIIFSIILIVGIGLLTVNSPQNIIPIMMKGAESSVNFAFKLFFIYAVWVSVLKILESSRADKGIAKALSPITKRLFKGEDEKTYSYINLNLSANILGMGGAATPMGVKSMENIKERKNKIMLVVINSASIQLIPTTILSMRAGFNASSDIMIPALIVNAITTILAIIFVKVFVR